MREIKYQAFVVVQKLDNLGPNMHLAGVSEYEVMIDVHNISFDKGKIDYITDLEGNEYSFFDKSLIAVREYTGLKDKYGKEIFEGDIVRVNKLTYETSGLLPENLMVKYYSGMFQFFRGENDCLMGLHLLYLDDGEVIGNIYEHKHLLEATA